jgi:predicted AlkP superfamily pyrophosphatase or phosphodiesterase/uncharacterized membrane protein YvlD (DUF360 family)
MKKHFALSSYLTKRQRFAQLVISLLAFYVSIYFTDSIIYNDLLAVFIAGLMVSVTAIILQPLFSLLTRLIGIFGILFVSFFGYAIVFWVAIKVTSDAVPDSFWSAIWASWIYAIIVTILNWIFVSQSDDVFLNEILKHSKIKNLPENTPSGFIFIQLDGVSAPVLDSQIKAGNLPNITRLIRENNYEFHSWHTQVPSTTPASQAGILLGSNDGIPAFRWYEKDTGKLVVANQVAGATLIEKRLSNGNGLLVDGGVSVGNLFSGDAPTNVMVMSKLEGDKQSIRNMREYTSYFSTPLGFMRSLILAIVEMIKEIYQAKRQVSRNVTPRIKRHGSYILLRAITNVLMRDLQTTIVIQNMMKGVNSLYVDYLDYDEVAHHAGMARPESLASLTGLDWVVGIIDRSREYAPRNYELILVSDHGQSQGPTFKQLHNGKTIESFIEDYIHNSKVQSADTPAEEQSTTAQALLTNQTFSKSKSNKKQNDETEQKMKQSDIVFTGSGNLGNVWLNKYKKPATLEQITNDFPKLIENIIGTNGVGMAMIRSTNGPVCRSINGEINLKNGKIIDTNPLEKYSVHDKNSLLRLMNMKNAPDIAIISEYNEVTGEVYAFEELVGNHGGLGGWQTEAILLHPKKLKIPAKFMTEGEIIGAESVHKILKSWLPKNPK